MQGKWWKLIGMVLLVGVIVGVVTFAGRYDKDEGQLQENGEEVELTVAADDTIVEVETTLDDDEDDDDDDEDDDDDDDEDDDD